VWVKPIKEFKMASSISKGTIRRLNTAVGSVPAGNEILGSLGQLGGFSVNADASIKVQQGDISVVPDSGGAAGTYRVMFPNVNSDIQSIAWFEVKGFTPRAPTGVETADARVCGYNFDATLKQWYITVQIVLLSSGAVDATPPAGFAIGVRAAFVLTPQANPQ
jgi:hypothetical protein